MSMTDPISSMLTSIRNAQKAGHVEVNMPSSKVKMEIARVLKEEGYINAFKVQENGSKKTLNVTLKYHEGVGVIEEIKRVSRPGLRRYTSVEKLPKMRGGLGIYIISTSKGLITDHQARKIGQGGEVICAVA